MASAPFKHLLYESVAALGWVLSLLRCYSNLPDSVKVSNAKPREEGSLGSWLWEVSSYNKFAMVAQLVERLSEEQEGDRSKL